MSKVLIIDGNGQYTKMFTDHGWEVTHDLTKADLVQFTGGADVSPFLYGQVNHRTTHNDPRRDLVEAGYYAVCVRMGIKMAGICRGGQFLNVMNGGSMYQDVDGHAIYGTHECLDFVTGELVQVTSTHHQMMIPNFDVGAELVACAAEVNCQHKDSEVVWYKSTKSLCFQPHPEFHGADSTREYYFQLLRRYLDF